MASQVPGLAPCSLPWDEQAHARAAGHTWGTPGAHLGHTWSPVVRSGQLQHPSRALLLPCLQGCYETGTDNAEQFLLPLFCPAAKSQFRGFCGSLACFGLFFALSLSRDLKELETGGQCNYYFFLNSTINVPFVP